MVGMGMWEARRAMALHTEGKDANVCIKCVS